MADWEQMQRPNDGRRSLFGSIPLDGLVHALRDWRSTTGRGLLVGDLAYNFHAKPLLSLRAQFLYRDTNDVPDHPPRFDRVGSRFRHLATGAIIRTMVAADARMTTPMLDYAFNNAKRSNGLLVADAATVAAMKLIEGSFQDDFDVVTLIRIGAVDLSAFRHFDIPLHRLTVLKIT